jgi:hypothetical protein
MPHYEYELSLQLKFIFLQWLRKDEVVGKIGISSRITKGALFLSDSLRS